MERERRGLFGMETNATLPADWKHQEPPKDQGMPAYYVIYCIVISTSQCVWRPGQTLHMMEL